MALRTDRCARLGRGTGKRGLPGLRGASLCHIALSAPARPHPCVGVRLALFSLAKPLPTPSTLAGFVAWGLDVADVAKRSASEAAASPQAAKPTPLPFEGPLPGREADTTAV